MSFRPEGEILILDGNYIVYKKFLTKTFEMTVNNFE